MPFIELLLLAWSFRHLLWLTDLDLSRVCKVEHTHLSIMAGETETGKARGLGTSASVHRSHRCRNRIQSQACVTLYLLFLLLCSPVFLWRTIARYNTVSCILFLRCWELQAVGGHFAFCGNWGALLSIVPVNTEYGGPIGSWFKIWILTCFTLIFSPLKQG